jgi:hypothetical protein
MKNIIKLMCVTLLFVTSCSDFEPVVYDSVNGQTGLGFTTTTTNVVVPPEGVTATINVQSTKTTSSDRTFNVSVNEAESTGTAADYTIGSLTIPANSYDGTLTVTFNNFDNLPDLVTNKLVLNIELSNGVAVVGSAKTTINYVKAVVCNDMVFTINEDAYADERNWQITDSTGAIVVQCSDYTDCPQGAPSGSIPAQQYVYMFNLPDGCYTFTIFDAFGDGLFDGNTTGDYELSCSIIVHAAGEGNFGSEESTDFCVNQ